MNDLTALRAAMLAVVGPAGLLTEPADIAPYETDWRGLYHGHTPFVVRPASTEEVAAVVRLCAGLRCRHRTAGRQHLDGRRRHAGGGRQSDRA